MRTEALSCLLFLAVLIADAPGSPPPRSFATSVRQAMGLPAYAALRESIGADVPDLADSITATIEPFCSHVWLGDRPRFRVRVWNHSSRGVLLVRALDESAAGRRPEVRVTFDGPPEGVQSQAKIRIDGGWPQAIETGDFALVAPGQALDLYGRGGYVDHAMAFVRPGRYAARFEYSTIDDDMRHWLGKYEADTLAADWRARFRRVPRLDLHAACGFEVQQR